MDTVRRLQVTVKPQYCVLCFFFKQKTAYEIKECDWSSDVCSSDLFIKRLERANQKHDRHAPELLRSEEHTSELQSHSFISYAVFCLKKKTHTTCTRRPPPSCTDVTGPCTAPRS